MEVAFRVLEVNLAHTECAHGMRTRNAHTECAHGMRTRAFYSQKLILILLLLLIKYIKL